MVARVGLGVGGKRESTLQRGLGGGWGKVFRFCDVFLLEQPNEFT